MQVETIERHGPLSLTTSYRDTKDPCPVLVGGAWHLFGSGGSVYDERWKIIHAVADSPTGAWKEEITELDGLVGDHVAAPGVIYEKETDLLHMYVQTDFMNLGGSIEYLTSDASGKIFIRKTAALASLPQTEEAGIYDPHPCVLRGEKYIVYSGASFMGVRGDKFIAEPNIFLAKSETNSWQGPWRRLGKILDHSEIDWHHNQLGHPEYEWGIEGPQILELPSGRFLLNATSFLPGGEFSTRQRVFFAIAEKVTGPYKSLGPVLDPIKDDWGKGENGHAAGLIQNNLLYLFYQGRSSRRSEDHSWRYGLALFDTSELERTYLAQYSDVLHRGAVGV